MLLFALAGRRFATDAARVQRVARRGENGVRFWGGTLLGEPEAGAVRGLVIESSAGEDALAIDAVHGMVVAEAVHRLPMLAADCMHGGGIDGLIEHEDELLPVVDVAALLRARIAREGSGVPHGGE